ncbi:unnamed protein product, partial [Didymodactylos carnosus]
MSILFLVRATGKENHNINIEISARQLHGKNRILVGQRANEIDPLGVFREHVKDANESLLLWATTQDVKQLKLSRKRHIIIEKRCIDEDIFKECRIIGRAYLTADVTSNDVKGMPTLAYHAANKNTDAKRENLNKSPSMYEQDKYPRLKRNQLTSLSDNFE